MGNVLNTGYNLWIPTFTLDGSTKIFQTIFMSKTNTVATPTLIDTQMRGNFAGTGRPFSPANMYIGYTLARTEVYMAVPGTVQYFLNETALVGTKAGSNGTPINTSTLIRKDTGVSGRHYRGRFMLPNLTVPEANINQAGIIDATGLAGIVGQWNSAFADWDSSAMDPVLGHSTSEIVPTPIISLTVLPKVGSMPHRIRGR